MGDIMIEITKIYVDKDGAGRIYIPKEMMEKLGWKNREKLLVNENGYTLVIKVAEAGI